MPVTLSRQSLVVADRVAADLDQTPTLWVATDLHCLIRPAHELGYRRRDLIQVDPDRTRVYRWLDRYWLGYLAAAVQRAQTKHAHGSLDSARWEAARARWATICTWADTQHGPTWTTHNAACPPPADYPATDLADRWCDRLVNWRRLHPELPA